MKFISKGSNMRIILSPSIPAEPLSGRSAVRGVSVLFEQGVARVDDPKICEQLLNHPSFNRDFILAPEEGVDPFASVRKDTEPKHSITELKFGTPVGRAGDPAIPKISPESRAAIAKMVEEGVKEGIKAILPGLVAEGVKAQLKDIVPALAEKIRANMESDTTPGLEGAGTASRRGRKPGSKNKPKEISEENTVAPLAE